MEKSLVISHYNENLDWINNIDTNVKIYLYTKNNIDLSHFKKNNVIIEKLDNIGNEQHTYFYHIVKNYNNLEDYIVFTQANPYEHSKFFNEKIENNYIGGLSDFNLITTVFGDVDKNIYKKHINHKYVNVNYKNICNKIFIDPWNDNNAITSINYLIDKLYELNIKKDNWIFNANGLYSTTKNNLNNLDINIYEKCLSLFYDTNINMVEFAFERLNKFIILK